jgi:hypothetical protein
MLIFNRGSLLFNHVKLEPIWLNSLNPSRKKIRESNSNCLPTDFATDFGSINISPKSSVISNNVKTISIEKKGFLKWLVKCPNVI